MLKIIKKYFILMLVVCFGSLVIIYSTINYHQPSVYEYQLVKTDESDFGYNPETQEYEAISTDAIAGLNSMLYEVGLAPNFNLPVSVSGCKSIYDYNFSTDDGCSSLLPLGIKKIVITDQLTIPLRLRVETKKIPNYTFSKNESGEIKFDFGYNGNFMDNRRKNIILNSINNMNKNENIKNYQNNLVFKVDYYYYYYNLKIYLIYLIIIVVCFWTAKTSTPRVNHIITNLTLLILTNLILFLGAHYFKQVVITKNILITYNILFIPTYLRIIWNNRK